MVELTPFEVTWTATIIGRIWARSRAEAEQFANEVQLDTYDQPCRDDWEADAWRAPGTVAEVEQGDEVVIDGKLYGRDTMPCAVVRAKNEGVK